METFLDRSRRLAKAAAQRWADVDAFLAKNPDLTDVKQTDALFALESAAEQAGIAYWENIDAEDAKGEGEEPDPVRFPGAPLRPV